MDEFPKRTPEQFQADLEQMNTKREAQLTRVQAVAQRLKDGQTRLDSETARLEEKLEGARRDKAAAEALNTKTNESRAILEEDKRQHKRQEEELGLTRRRYYTDKENLQADQNSFNLRKANAVEEGRVEAEKAFRTQLNQAQEAFNAEKEEADRKFNAALQEAERKGGEAVEEEKRKLSAELAEQKKKLNAELEEEKKKLNNELAQEKAKLDTDGPAKILQAEKERGEAKAAVTKAVDEAREAAKEELKKAQQEIEQLKEAAKQAELARNQIPLDNARYKAVMLVIGKGTDMGEYDIMKENRLPPSLRGISDILKPFVESWDKNEKAKKGEHSAGTGKYCECPRRDSAGKSLWTLEDEQFYACKLCSTKGRPCILWNPEMKQYFLLPLHPILRVKFTGTFKNLNIMKGGTSPATPNDMEYWIADEYVRGNDYLKKKKIILNEYFKA